MDHQPVSQPFYKTLYFQVITAIAAWSDWLASHAGLKVAARRTRGNTAGPAIEPAPGRHVKAKAA